MIIVMIMILVIINDLSLYIYIYIYMYQSTKSGVGEQFLQLDCVAEARVEVVFFQTPVSRGQHIAHQKSTPQK